MGRAQKRSRELVTEISQSAGVPMKTVEVVIAAYLENLRKRVKIAIDNPLPVSFGIATLDHQLKLHPGMTIIYGPEMMGKTAMAKRIALAGKGQGLNVMFWDAENKLFLHDLEQMEGIVLANARWMGGIKEFVSKSCVDLVVIDTLTSMEERTYLIRMIRDRVPYVVMTSQMRESWKHQKMIPACYEPTLASSHTKIHLTGREPVTVESVDMLRVQFVVDKYEADRTLEGTRGSFIVNDGIVDNAYTAYDYLKTRGRISSLGTTKKLDGTDLGGRFRDVVKTQKGVEVIMQALWADLHGGTQLDLGWYFDDRYLRELQSAS